ncbi:hypothetical protein, partial [Xanthomonas fragariae]
MHESFKQGAPAEVWQALVREAGQRIARPLDESREHYLVFVLLRFQRDAHLLSRTQALAWLHAQEQSGSVRADLLRDVGDGCLLIAGLFPGVAQRRRLSVDYFIDLGRGAYSDVADSRCSDAGLFVQLAESYRDLVRT